MSPDRSVTIRRIVVTGDWSFVRAGSEIEMSMWYSVTADDILSHQATLEIETLCMYSIPCSLTSEATRHPSRVAWDDPQQTTRWTLKVGQEQARLTKTPCPISIARITSKSRKKNNQSERWYVPKINLQLLFCFLVAAGKGDPN